MDQIQLLLAQGDNYSILKMISKQLGKYAFYKSNYFITRRTSRKSTLVKSPVYVPRYLSPFQANSVQGSRRHTIELYSIRNSSVRTTPKSDTNAYTLDQYLTIQNVFNKLVNTYENTAWVRETCDKEINITLIKQFWLDSSVCDQGFFNLLLISLKDKVWINSESFTKSFNELHSEPTWNIFSPKRLASSKNEKFVIQKTLCKSYFSLFLYS